MFYNQDILTKKSGTFGVIWLAATLGPRSSQIKKLTKKEVNSVNVVKTCDYLQAPPDPLSLRLTSNLVVGLTRIHNQQYTFYYNDVQDVHSRLKRSFLTSSAEQHSLNLSLPAEKTVARYEQITMPDDVFIEDIPIEKPLRLSGITITNDDADFEWIARSSQAGDMLSRFGSSSIHGGAGGSRAGSDIPSSSRASGGMLLFNNASFAGSASASSTTLPTPNKWNLPSNTGAPLNDPFTFGLDLMNDTAADLSHISFNGFDPLANDVLDWNLQELDRATQRDQNVDAQVDEYALLGDDHGLVLDDLLADIVKSDHNAKDRKKRNKDALQIPSPDGHDRAEATPSITANNEEGSMLHDNFEDPMMAPLTPDEKGDNRSVEDILAIESLEETTVRQQQQQRKKRRKLAIVDAEIELSGAAMVEQKEHFGSYLLQNERMVYKKDNKRKADAWFERELKRPCVGDVNSALMKLYPKFGNSTQPTITTTGSKHATDDNALSHFKKSGKRSTKKQDEQDLTSGGGSFGQVSFGHDNYDQYQDYQNDVGNWNHETSVDDPEVLRGLSRGSGDTPLSALHRRDIFPWQTKTPSSQSTTTKRTSYSGSKLRSNLLNELGMDVDVLGDENDISDAPWRSAVFQKDASNLRQSRVSQSPGAGSTASNLLDGGILFEGENEPFVSHQVVGLEDSSITSHNQQDCYAFLSYAKDIMSGAGTKYVFFNDLLPAASTTRVAAVTAFHHVLNLATRHEIKPIQESAFGDIKIQLLE